MHGKDYFKLKKIQPTLEKDRSTNSLFNSSGKRSIIPRNYEILSCCWMMKSDQLIWGTEHFWPYQLNQSND